jgi:hypothetical protein
MSVSSAGDAAISFPGYDIEIGIEKNCALGKCGQNDFFDFLLFLKPS